jgi:hypothetical protein
MAGYPFGAWDSFSRRGYEYATLLFPKCSVPVAFNLYVMVTALLPPFLIALAAAVLGLGRRRILLCLSLAVLIYQVDNLPSYFWSYGNVAFPLANALAVLYVASALVGIRRRSPPLLVGAGLLLALMFWLHQLAILPALAGSLAIVWARRDDLFHRWGFLYGAIIPLVALLMVLPWLTVLWSFADTRMPRESTALPSGWKYLVMDLLSDRTYRHAFDRRALFHIYTVLLGVGAVWSWQRRNSVGLVYSLTAAAAFVAAYVFAGAEALRATEPYRFLVSFAFFAVIPASFGLRVLLVWVRRSDVKERVLVTALALVLTPSLLGYIPDIAALRSSEGQNVSQRAVLQWLKTEGHRDGRVLCFDEVLADLVPHFAGQEVLGGGLSRSSPLKHKLSWLNGRDIFRKPAESFDPAELAAYLNLYNVGYVVAPDERYAEKILSVEGWAECHRTPGYVVYSLDRARLSYVMGATGSADTRVKADMNRIRVSGAPVGRFTLKYHFLDSLRAPAGIRVFPMTMANDPVPFVGVDNVAGLDAFEIRNEQ